jgi:Family of unknown function (DUF5678)
MSPETRLQSLRDAPPGGWVAFSENEDRVVAYGATYDEAVCKAQEQGVTDPVLVKVPRDWTELVLYC